MIVGMLFLAVGMDYLRIPEAFEGQEKQRHAKRWGSAFAPNMFQTMFQLLHCFNRLNQGHCTTLGVSFVHCDV